MSWVERHTQRVRRGKWDALREWEKDYDALYSRHGYPAPTRYRCIYGGHPTTTRVYHREWGSLAAMEAAYDKTMADPEDKGLGERLDGIIEHAQVELLLKEE